MDPNRSLLGLARRSTLICCLNTKISASSVARDRSRSIIVPKISLHKFNIELQHRPILNQPPADWIYDRDNRHAGPGRDRSPQGDLRTAVARVPRRQDHRTASLLPSGDAGWTAADREDVAAGPRLRGHRP